ncbi:uncharacterized protein [Amphiura filiformis]|uniref:uncharacterized protein n=1 Tax=Amphiura filiformis TaxID=82378 RepID=UPI003B226DE6
MLKFLTQKLRAQSLNEVQPFEPTETDKVSAQEVEEEYHTDSEEENLEVEQLFQERKMCNGNYGSSPGPASIGIVAPHPIKPRPLEDSVNSTENILSCESRDRHSSEEELAHIERQAPEKRKWSQVCGLNGESSGSSDDEVKELCARPMPLRFSASPPRHLQKITRKHSDGSTMLFVANVGPSISDFASPRKRHRQSCTDDAYVQNGRCMDFEKMQQKLRKHSLHGVRGARMVRIKSIQLNNSRVPPRLLCDPAVFSFRSLSTISPMTPVEDPAPHLTAY